MISCEPDPDVIRWGLNLLEGVPSLNSGYCETATQNDGTLHEGEYDKEVHFSRSDRVSIENDEIIAYALQEEFSELAVAEGSRSSQVGERHLEASILAQDWLGPSMGNSCPGHERGREEGNEMDPPSPCSSTGEKSYDGEEWYRSLELTDDFSILDGEVGKRLNQMASIPHVPRINGEIPSMDEATSDHQRLIDRLRTYDLVELKVQGDGNCQFRSISDQLYRSPEHHKFVRQQVVSQLNSHPEIYEGYVPMTYNEYLRKMSKVGEWGDHVTLQAASDWYGVKIFMITSFKDTCYIEILPNVEKSKRVVFLSFWAEVHYNSIYPEGDMPARQTKKKRRVDFLEQMPSYCMIM